MKSELPSAPTDREPPATKTVTAAAGSPTGNLSNSVPAHLIDEMLSAGIAAYQQRKFKPWRFLVIRDRARLAGLQRIIAATGGAAADGQAMIAIFTSLAFWRRSAAALFPEWARDQRLIGQMLRSLADTEVLGQQLRQLCTYMSLAARALGWEANALLDLPRKAMRRELELTGSVEIVGLLVIRPRGERPATASEEVAALAFEERLEQPWIQGGSIAVHA